MKKILICLIILGLVGIIGFIGLILPLRYKLSNKVYCNNILSEDYLKDQIDNFIIRKFKDIYIIKDIIYNKEFNNNDLSYFVKIYYTLKLNNYEEHPIIKSYKKFLNENSFSNYKKVFLEKQLNYWVENIKNYINIQQELNIRFKGIKENDKLSLYIEDPLGNYILAENSIEIKNYSELEKEFYEYLIKNFLNFNFKNSETKYNYNPSICVNYANMYTSNTTKKIWCSSDPNDWVYQDTNYYNPNYLAFCGDCANYVSQSVCAGGIPTDSIWRPYTTSWTYCPDLNNYMWSNYCYLTYYRPYAVPGSICMMDQNNNGNPDHTTIIVYNDGSILKYSAHTHDRKQYILPTLSFPVWFLVFY